MRQGRVTQKDILLLSISMFVIVILWIGFNLYHAWATSTISKDLKIQIIPIEGKFDTQIIDKLKMRQKIQPIFEISSAPVATPAAEEITPAPAVSEVTPTPITPEEFLIEEAPTETPITEAPTPTL